MLLIGCAMYGLSDEGHFIKSKLNSVFKDDATIQQLGVCLFIIT